MQELQMRQIDSSSLSHVALPKSRYVCARQQKISGEEPHGGVTRTNGLRPATRELVAKVVALTSAFLCCTRRKAGRAD